MTAHEAMILIESWIRKHSRSAATIVQVTSEGQGTWVALVECSAAMWKQIVSHPNEVSAPLIE